MAERSSGAGTDSTAESAGVDASSAGVQISVGILNLEQFRNSHGYRISSTGQRTIINGRAGATSLRPEISLLSTGTQMELEITSDWWNDVMEELYIPSREIEVMQLSVEHIGLGVEPYMGMWCRSIKRKRDFSERLEIVGNGFTQLNLHGYHSRKKMVKIFHKAQKHMKIN